MFTEDQLLPISALQHLLFCPRQCALIHLEQLWAENRRTAEGRVLHEKAHEGPDESRPGVRITRSLPLRSLRLGLSGQADVVEFHLDGTVFPIEYKRGQPKENDCDRVQLCAQALCLEEMQSVAIAHAALYYGERRRRVVVPIDADLRLRTEAAVANLHALIASRRTPLAVREKKCEACSLIDLCLPAVLARRSTAAWFSRAALQSPLDP